MFMLLFLMLALSKLEWSRGEKKNLSSEALHRTD